ncbi:MAG: IS1595 family transposase, partial [Nonlabens sp.]
FCFRINRLQSKSTIFNNIITKMVLKENVQHSELMST